MSYSDHQYFVKKKIWKNVPKGLKIIQITNALSKKKEKKKKSGKTFLSV